MQHDECNIFDFFDKVFDLKIKQPLTKARMLKRLVFARTTTKAPTTDLESDKENVLRPNQSKSIPMTTKEDLNTPSSSGGRDADDRQREYIRMLEERNR